MGNNIDLFNFDVIVSEEKPWLVILDVYYVFVNENKTQYYHSVPSAVYGMVFIIDGCSFHYAHT